MIERLSGPALALAVLVPSAAMAADVPVTIDRVKVERKTNTVGRRRGEDYLRVSFTATPNERIGPKMTVMVTGRVRGSVLTRTDDINALGAKLELLEPGTGKDLTVPLFMTEGLPAGIKNMDLTFALVRTLEKRGRSLGDFCWDGGSVSAGACR